MLDLPDVTLCAVTGVAVSETLDAMTQAQRCANFADAILVTNLTQHSEGLPSGIRHIHISGLQSRSSYSEVLQTQLVDLVHTSHVMIVQWDGYPVRPQNWTEEFLEFDYIGAPWPQFPASVGVGNGGFSLRSKRLLLACMDADFVISHPEDLSICQRNRGLLERGHGIRFAPIDLARRFSHERSGDPALAFGFHGVFNMPREMGVERFLDLLTRMERANIGTRELWDLRDELARDRSMEARLARTMLRAELLDRHRFNPATWLRLLGLWKRGQRVLASGSR